MGEREDGRTEWTHPLPPPPAALKFPEAPLWPAFLSVVGLPVPTSTDSPHFPFVIEPQISTFYMTAPTTFPKAEKTITSAHSHCLELGTTSWQSRKQGRRGLMVPLMGMMVSNGLAVHPRTHPSHPREAPLGRRARGPNPPSCRARSGPHHQA